MPLDTKSNGNGRAFKVVGTRPVRPDGFDKVTGRARFGADMNAPGLRLTEAGRPYVGNITLIRR